MGPKFSWPTVDDVIQFRRRVRELILDVIDRSELELPVTFDSPMVGPESLRNRVIHEANTYNTLAICWSRRTTFA